MAAGNGAQRSDRIERGMILTVVLRMAGHAATDVPGCQHKIKFGRVMFLIENHACTC